MGHVIESGLPRSAWRCVAATPWLTSRSGASDGGRRVLHEFLRATWRLPTWAPPSSAHHALSPLLPPGAGLAPLLSALHGRLVIVNQSPVAAVSRAHAALVRGLVSAALDGLPPEPWPAAPVGGAATWPRDSRSAHAAVLAHAWLLQHAARRAWRRAPAVAVGLYEGPVRVTTAEVGDAGADLAPDVRARLASRLPPPTLTLPRVVATAEYRLVVVTARRGSERWALDTAVPSLDREDQDHGVGEALDTGSTVGGRAPGEVWFSGRVLLPDAAVVAAMDERSRQRWAAFTGRAGTNDRYWFPDSWARFLEPGRVLGCVSAATVGQSMPSGRGGRARSGAAFGPSVERGVCVPPGYALVDCVGTVGVDAVIG